MNDSMAQAEGEAGPPLLPAWKSWVSALAATLLALVFLAAGLWKITDPVAAAARLSQARLPLTLSLPLGIVLGISETFAGVLLLVPRMRRWGSWLAGLLLLAFVIYIAAFYGVLRGQECNCFPWIKRAVGPGFFAGDALMLLLALVAGWWARRPTGRRSAVVILGAVTVFALVSYGITIVRQSWLRAPETIVAGGKNVALREGRVFLYFFDPECLHCDHGARQLSRLKWGETTVVGVAVEHAQFGEEFMASTGLQGLLSTDSDALREVFKFSTVPFGVALESGRQRASFTSFEDLEPAATLRRLGFAH